MIDQSSIENHSALFSKSKLGNNLRPPSAKLMAKSKKNN